MEIIEIEIQKSEVRKDFFEKYFSGKFHTHENITAGDIHYRRAIYSRGKDGKFEDGIPSSEWNSEIEQAFSERL